MAIEDIMQTAREFPTSVSGDNAFAYEVFLQSYDRLNLNDNFDFIQIQNRQNVLADLGEKCFEFLKKRDDVSTDKNQPKTHRQCDI